MKQRLPCAAKRAAVLVASLAFFVGNVFAATVERLKVTGGFKRILRQRTGAEMTGSCCSRMFQRATSCLEICRQFERQNR